MLTVQKLNCTFVKKNDCKHILVYVNNTTEQVLSLILNTESKMDSPLFRNVTLIHTWPQLESYRHMYFQDTVIPIQPINCPPHSMCSCASARTSE